MNRKWCHYVINLILIFLISILRKWKSNIVVWRNKVIVIGSTSPPLWAHDNTNIIDTKSLLRFYNNGIKDFFFILESEYAIWVDNLIPKNWDPSQRHSLTMSPAWKSDYVPSNMWNELFFLPQTLTVTPLRFRNGWLISSHVLWLI